MRNPKNPFPEMSDEFWREETRRDLELRRVLASWATKDATRDSRSMMEAAERQWAKGEL